MNFHLEELFRFNHEIVDGDYYPYQNQEEEKEGDYRRFPRRNISFNNSRLSSEAINRSGIRYSFRQRINSDGEPNFMRHQIFHPNNNQANDTDLRKINSLLYQPYYNLINKS